jgi:hypothetical protein
MRNFKRPGLWLGAAAVVLAMGGTATAASMVTSANIKDGTIAAKDIKRGAIGTAQLSAAAKRGMEGPEGATGPMGPIGPPGPMGPAGPSVVGKVVVVTAKIVVAAEDVDTVTAVCPAGHRIVSGGFTLIGGDVWLSKSYDNVSWSVGSSGWSIPTEAEAFAHCAPAGVAVAASAGAQAKRDAAIERAEKAYRAKLR